MLVFRMKEIYLKEIDSTNKYLKEHHQELDDMTFVYTFNQTKGKGRNERTWVSEKDQNLLFSLLIKNKDTVSLGGYLSLVTSISVLEVLKDEFAIKDIKIKWPNDIYICSKKVCGILLEGELPNYIILGVGINVNQSVFTGEYRVNPTSLRLQTRQEIDKEKLKEKIFKSLLFNLDNINKDSLFLRFNEYDYLKNKEITFFYNNEENKGIYLGVDKDFNALIEVNNKTISLSSGEISTIKTN